MIDPAIEPERRNAARRRALKGAHIVFNSGRSTIDCVVRNASSHGARLRVESTVGVPDEFELVLDDGRQYHGRIIWRSGQEIGVEFGRIPVL